MKRFVTVHGCVIRVECVFLKDREIREFKSKINLKNYRCDFIAVITDFIMDFGANKGKSVILNDFDVNEDFSRKMPKFFNSMYIHA